MLISPKQLKRSRAALLAELEKDGKIISANENEIKTSLIGILQ
jgi:hypothetical protein